MTTPNPGRQRPCWTRTQTSPQSEGLRPGPWALSWLALLRNRVSRRVSLGAFALSSRGWCYPPPPPPLGKSPAPQPGSPAAQEECCPRNGQLGWAVAWGQLCSRHQREKFLESSLHTGSCRTTRTRRARRRADEAGQSGHLWAVSEAGGSGGPWRCTHSSWDLGDT